MTTRDGRGQAVTSLPDLGEAPAWHSSRWFNTSTPLDLAGLRGQVVLMHAFQMLCPGCVSHGVPQAERVHRRFAALGVAVVGFHTVFEHHEAMTPVALSAFLHEYRVTHPVAVDLPVAGQPLPATMAAYDMQGTPTTILLDRDGRIRLQSLGGVDDLELGTLIGRLLGG
ncbi:MAG: redoxin family protein [Burkholderiaceae bacterium]|nr:redoxin family protein [Burkholderiaceae bacterium]